MRKNHKKQARGQIQVRTSSLDLLMASLGTMPCPGHVTLCACPGTFLVITDCPANCQHITAQILGLACCRAVVLHPGRKAQEGLCWPVAAHADPRYRRTTQLTTHRQNICLPSQQPQSIYFSSILMRLFSCGLDKML